MDSPSPIRSEIVGGLVSAAVAIPLAMGYGMFAFASLGENYFADGAFAGLATALVVAAGLRAARRQDDDRLCAADQQHLFPRVS